MHMLLKNNIIGFQIQIKIYLPTFQLIYIQYTFNPDILQTHIYCNQLQFSNFICEYLLETSEINESNEFFSSLPPSPYLVQTKLN